MRKISKDKRESSARHLFVGSQIDDAGLTPAQFRVLGRVARRGKCTESISNISKGSKIGINQCRRTIKELEQKGWIRRTDIKGRGVILELTIINALPLTDELGVTPNQSVSTPLTDKLSNPLTDKLDKGTTNKELLERIYNEYPRKVGKADALKAIEKALKKERFEFLLERTKAYAKERQGQDSKFTPYPAKWFNKEHYHDEIEQKTKADLQEGWE